MECESTAAKPPEAPRPSNLGILRRESVPKMPQIGSLSRWGYRRHGGKWRSEGTIVLVGWIRPGEKCTGNVGKRFTFQEQQNADRR